MTNISKQIEVNNYIIEIITEIIYYNCYVSYDLILTILLERYDVISFEQLQCGSIFEIQSLSLVFELNKKVKRHWVYNEISGVVDDENDNDIIVVVVDDDDVWWSIRSNLLHLPSKHNINIGQYIYSMLLSNTFDYLFKRSTWWMLSIPKDFQHAIINTHRFLSSRSNCPPI